MQFAQPPIKNGKGRPLLTNAADGLGIHVTPKDSVDEKEIRRNAEENLKLLPHDAWLRKCAITNETAWIVSAGPSLERKLEQGYLRPEWFAPGTGNTLFTIKHALPTLHKYGFVPHFCVVLDPRPIEGVSTHGRVRRTLYSSANNSVRFLVASMTHPSVTSWLIKNGYKVFGWHSAANGLKGLPGASYFISGGTCSATRGISLCHYMGFRKVNILAFDSNLAEKPTNLEEFDIIEGRRTRKFWPVKIGDSPEFWTTGELIAQVQDMSMFLNDEIPDIEINIIGTDKQTSLMGALNEVTRNKTKELRHYSEQTAK